MLEVYCFGPFVPFPLIERALGVASRIGSTCPPRTDERAVRSANSGRQRAEPRRAQNGCRPDRRSMHFAHRPRRPSFVRSSPNSRLLLLLVLLFRRHVKDRTKLADAPANYDGMDPTDHTLDLALPLEVLLVAGFGVATTPRSECVISSIMCCSLRCWMRALVAVGTLQSVRSACDAADRPHANPTRAEAEAAAAANRRSEMWRPFRFDEALSTLSSVLDRIRCCCCCRCSRTSRSASSNAPALARAASSSTVPPLQDPSPHPFPSPSPLPRGSDQQPVLRASPCSPRLLLPPEAAGPAAASRSAGGGGSLADGRLRRCCCFPCGVFLFFDFRRSVIVIGSSRSIRRAGQREGGDGTDDDIGLLRGEMGPGLASVCRRSSGWRRKVKTVAQSR
jgi:hypothetical protein